MDDTTDDGEPTDDGDTAGTVSAGSDAANSGGPGAPPPATDVDMATNEAGVPDAATRPDTSSDDADAGGVGSGDDASTAPDQPLDLPATAWALLGLLSFDREMSGYDLKKWADSSLAFFYWSPAPSQIYAELRRLERLGLVSSRAEPTDNRKKRVFAITPAGTTALQIWLAQSDPGLPILKHGLALRAWLGHLIEPSRLHELVVDHREQMHDLAQRAADAAARGRDLGWQHPAAVIDWCSRYYAAQAALTDELLDDLERLSTDD